MALNKIYTDETAARKHLERLLWPEGPFCPHCGNADPKRIHKLQGKSHREGVYKCRECEKPFSVTVGTAFESSHVPLHKWVYATHLLTASKKGISSHQLMRMLGVSYKTAWFMSHRIREGMRPTKLTPMGGGGKIVEIDETASGRVEGAPKRARRLMGGFGRTVLTLVERGGSARSFHVEGTTSAQLIPIIRANVAKESAVMTDAASWYKYMNRDGHFVSHDRVDHTNDEYVRREGDKLITTNTVEGYYSIFKRGMKGVYQHCGEKHLHRYLAEFDFRCSNRIALGVDDQARAEKALQGITGKRLTYRRPHGLTQSGAH
ncbi:MAG: IS1595 family transposase [Xanthobacteraceae bacterium]